MQIVDHALKIASPKEDKISSQKTKRLASSSSNESESPSLQRHLEQAEPIQGESLDETAPLSPDLSCSSGTTSLAHSQPHQHIAHLKQEAPSSPGWKLREDFKAEPSPGSLRGTLLRKAFNANDLPDALRLAALDATSSPGHNQKKPLDSEINLVKDESFLAPYSQDRKMETKQSKLNGSGHTNRELERQEEQVAAKQRVQEQAAKQQQQLAPHNRLGVALHGAGIEVYKPASCLVDRIPAQVWFQAKGFLGEADDYDDSDDDDDDDSDDDDDDDDGNDQSVGSVSILTLSLGSVEQQKELMQSSRWDMMDDSMMGVSQESRSTLSPEGWQLRERIKSSVLALHTIPGGKPAVPIRQSTDHTEESKCIAVKLPDDGDDFLGFLNAAAVPSETDCKPAAPIRQTTNHGEGKKCVAPKLPDEGQDFLAFLQTKVQDEKKQLDLPPISPRKRSSLIKAQASKLEAAVSKHSKGNDLRPACSTTNESSEYLSSSMLSFASFGMSEASALSFGAVKPTSSFIPDNKPAAPIRQATNHGEGRKCVASKLPDEGQDFLAFLQTKVEDEKKQLDLPPIFPKKRSSLIKVQAGKPEAAVFKPSKGNHLRPASSTIKASSEHLSPSMLSFASFELSEDLFSSALSFGAIKAISSSIPDSKPAAPIRQSTRHEGEKCVAPSKLPDEGQDFLAYLQTKVQDEKKQLDLPPISSKKRSSLTKAPASKPKRSVSSPSVLSSPTRCVPPKKASVKGIDLPPALSIMNTSSERLSSSALSLGAVKATSSATPDLIPAAPIRQSTRHEGNKCVAPKLPDEGQDFLAFLQTKVQDEMKQLDLPPISAKKASKQATSKNEPSTQPSTENSNPRSKVKSQKKAFKPSLKDEPSVDNSANNNVSAHTPNSRIKLKRVSKKASSDTPTLVECANNGCSSAAVSKKKLKRVIKKSSSAEPSLVDDSANDGSSRTKLERRVSKKSSKDEMCVDKSGRGRGSNGELSKQVSSGSKSRHKRVSKHKPSLDGST
jgi:hypothetical protein